MYTEEELELLQSDPELQELQLTIRSERIKAEEDEIAEWDRQRQIDDAIEGPLLQLKQKDRLWKEWSAQWWNYTAYDRALQKSIEELAEKLLWVEDEELNEREGFEALWLEEWMNIQRVERKRYRLITEWFAVWNEEKEGVWAAQREHHQKEIDAMMWRMFDGKAADEAEIARWENEIAELLSRIQEKCDRGIPPPQSVDP